MQKYVLFRLGIACCFIVSFLGVSTASSASAGGYSSALRRYPYLTDVVRSYATINWATDRSKSGGGVRYGKKGSESCTAHYVSASKTAIAVNGAQEYQWKAQLKLAPGSQYCYRIYLGKTMTGETDLLGLNASPSFWTQVPRDSTQPFSFVVIGDWGRVNSSGENSYQARLMSLIASSGARFVVTTGDNGYPSGTQKNYGDLVQTGSNLSAVFGPAFWKVPGASIPIFPAPGNHGYYSPDSSHPALVNWPENQAVSGSRGRYQEETYCCLNGTTSQEYPSIWYAFDAGSARFYILTAAWADTHLGTASSGYQMDYDYHWAPGTDQYEWLKADFASHPSVLKFVFFHYPMYSDSAAHPSNTFLQGSNHLEGLLKKNRVAIVFTGHSHIYQRNRASAVGVINYVTGGGGATLGTLNKCSPLDEYAIGFSTTGKACGSAPVPTSAAQVHHFLKVTVNGSRVTVTPINSLGKPFDVMNYNFSTDLASDLLPVPTGPAAATPTELPTP